MNSEDKNTMVRNLRTFIEKGNTGLRDYQNDALIAVEKFMRLPNGAEFMQAGSVDTDTQEKGIKKGNYLEVVSATGSGKTRMFGTMAKAMNVPTLIVTPRNLLNKNTRKEFCNKIGIAEKDIAIYDSQQSKAARKRILEGNPPPKFVITSYQSLPTLVNRHELDFTNRNDVHYRPLIILDEVHEGQGPERTAIINKLKEHVLVAGFTATDAGAAKRLFEGQKPIYNLPIDEAIKRHILCTGVRAATIDVTIDEDWINNFANTKKGKEYNHVDLEKFASTPSVIEGAISHHLTAEYDDFGKLSRLPTIFYTEGVEAARYGAQRFNAMAKELGVNAKAAYVSGYMEEKQYDPILEQFKKGKIQAVFNDKLLGMGFDAPNATVCYSLKPSNLRHTVEQQLGRVTRKQDDDYFEKYGQNKVALAFNVRGVGMNPYTFVQVLGEPAIYSDEYVKKPLPKITTPKTIPGQPKDKHLLPEGVTVTFEYGEMEEVLADANNQRAGLPKKTKDFLTSEEMAEFAITNRRKTRVLYGELEKAWLKAKEKAEASFTAEGLTFPVDKGGIFQSGSKQAFYLHKDLANDIKSHLHIPQRTEDFLNGEEMTKEVHVDSRKIYALYNELEKAWLKAENKEEETFSAEGMTFPVTKAGIFKRNSSQLTFHLHKSLSEDLVKHFTKNYKPEGFLPAAPMAKLAHVDPNKVYELYDKLEKPWLEAKKKGETSFSADDITLPVNKAGIFQNRNHNIFYLHKDLAKNITAHFAMPERNKDFLTATEMATAAHTDYSNIREIYQSLEKAWLLATKKGEATFTAKGITLHVDKAIISQGRIPAFCVHKDMVSHFSTPLKPKDFLAPEEMSTYADISRRKTRVLYGQLEKAWLKVNKNGETSFTADGITLPVDKAGIFQSRNHKIFYLHKDLAKDLIMYFKKEKSPKTSFVDIVGGKKSIAHDREDLERTGRVRGS